MKIVGIDPGLSGAIALLGYQSNRVIVWDTPTLAVRMGKGQRTYDAQSMVELLHKIKPDYAVLERQQAMVGFRKNPATGAMEKVPQGVSSTFKTGYGYGLWLGILIGLGIPHLVVSPQMWQKEMYQGAVGEGKARSMYVAGQLFPGVHILKSKHGRADAILLAEYGRRKRGS